MNIKLNVGGQMFETDYATIIKIPYFCAMLETCDNTDEVIFVNRSSHIFKHVLALMIDSLHPFPSKYAYELDFYGVDYKNIKLHENQLLVGLQNDMEHLKILMKGDTLCKDLECQNIVYQGNYCPTHRSTGIFCNPTNN